MNDKPENKLRGSVIEFKNPLDPASETSDWQALEETRYDRLADMLEEAHGHYPEGRQALIVWLTEQLERAKRLPGATTTDITAMIDAGYIQKCAELLGIEDES